MYFTKEGRDDYVEQSNDIIVNILLHTILFLISYTVSILAIATTSGDEVLDYFGDIMLKLLLLSMLCNVVLHIFFNIVTCSSLISSKGWFKITLFRHGSMLRHLVMEPIVNTIIYACVIIMVVPPTHVMTLVLVLLVSHVITGAVIMMSFGGDNIFSTEKVAVSMCCNDNPITTIHAVVP